ncbi:MAG: SDR family oxidoreductase [Candidatus Neomarinimicrobiota bacterium]
MQHVFITGANRGIGLGLVRHALDRGNRVFAGCRSPENAGDLNHLHEEHGDRLLVLPLDVTNRAAIEGAVATLQGFTAGLDVLFNNAGVGGDKAPLGRLEPQDLLDIFAINAVAPLMIAQACLPLLQKGGRPVIANITSRMGSIADNGSGGWYSYRASKAALNMINACLALDLSSRGIISVVLHPGWVQTDLGGAGATLPVDQSVSGLWAVVDGLKPGDSGRFLAWDGEEIPW